MSKRPTIGDDPLAAFIGSAAPRQDVPRKRPAASPTKGAKPRATDTTATSGRDRLITPDSSRAKVKATFIVPAALVAEARSAVVALAGPPVRLTLARLVEDALRRELDRLNKAHHQGKPWPDYKGTLTGGRPIGT